LIEPIRVAIEVDCEPEHAFRTWTDGASTWWPAAHTASHEHGAQIVFEPRVGGRIFERTASGKEIDWGYVTEWDPPRRLRYQWHIAADPADATDVEIVFRELDGTLTRVEIEHRGWEKLGAEKGRSWRDVNHGGWDGVLPAYIAACTKQAA
jgi:Activator of Hsp90 ATPase homolog 1-like protein